MIVRIAKKRVYLNQLIHIRINKGNGVFKKYRKGGKGMITPTLIYRYSIELYVSTECSLAESLS